MPKNREIPFNLAPPDELFSTQEEREEVNREKVHELPLSELDQFPDHPYRVVDDEAMARMVETVKLGGIVTPALVRKKEDGRYEIISGHRRKHAAELAGLGTIPAIIRDMTKDEAVIAMVDSNLQREEVLPSEKAFSYKMKLDAIKRQAGRPAKNSVPVAQNFQGKTSRQIIAEQSGESQDQVRRYIRLTELIVELLDLVDEGKMGMRPAVELSYLEKKDQVTLFNEIEFQDCIPSHAQARELRYLAEKGELTSNVINSILAKEKPNQVEQFKIPRKKLSKYFKPGTPKDVMEARIIKGLELLERQERNRDRER